MIEKFQLYKKGPFFLLLFVMSWAYNYQDIFTKPPMSTHTWRQSDGASMALTYYQQDRPFFKPKLHNLLGNDGQSVGEFPIVYYVVGKLYSIFGPKEAVFRVFSTLIFFLGLFYLFRLGLLVLDDTFYSLALVAIAFSSPIVAFYANNFMPNVHALSFAYISWFYIASYIKNKKNKDIYLAILFFSLAGMIKITALISLCVFICVMLYEMVFIEKSKRKILSKNLQPFFLSFIPFLFFFAWLMYAHSYQTLNANSYFSLDWDPFWIETAEIRLFIWQRLTQDWGWWLDLYLNLTIYLSLFLPILLFTKKVSYFWRASVFAYYCGVALFIMLYFSAINHHDYYLVNLFPLVTFLFLFLFYFFKKKGLLNSKIVMLILAVFVFLNIQHTDKRMHYRYHPKLIESEFSIFYDLKQEDLNEIGITADKKILYDGEYSYCSALYSMNRYGWSWAYGNFGTPEEMQYYKDKGAEYLVVLGKERIEKPIYQNLELIKVFKDELYFYKLDK